MGDSLSFTNLNRSEKAQDWRMRVTMRTIRLLQATVKALDYNGRNEIHSDLGSDEVKEENMRNFRKPVELAFNLRQEIMSFKMDEDEEDGMGSIKNLFSHPAEYMMLTACVDTYMEAFHKLEANMLTPIPFPVTQMARTILFFFVFTLPFALCHDDYSLFGVSILVFILSFGFIGLEYVSMEMTDPFGDDENDFDDSTIAMMVFEDIYAMVNFTEGEDTALEIMEEMNANDDPQL